MRPLAMGRHEVAVGGLVRLPVFVGVGRVPVTLSGPSTRSSGLPTMPSGVVSSGVVPIGVGHVHGASLRPLASAPDGRRVRARQRDLEVVGAVAARAAQHRIRRLVDGGGTGRRPGLPRRPERARACGRGRRRPGGPPHLAARPASIDGRDRDERKGVGRAVAHLAVDCRPPAGWRQRHRRDESRRASGTVSICGVRPGRRWKSATGMLRVCRRAAASRPSRRAPACATSMSDGLVAMQSSLAPTTAWIRLKPADGRAARARLALVAGLGTS